MSEQLRFDMPAPRTPSKPTKGQRRKKATWPPPDWKCGHCGEKADAWCSFRRRHACLHCGHDLERPDVIVIDWTKLRRDREKRS